MKTKHYSLLFLGLFIWNAAVGQYNIENSWHYGGTNADELYDLISLSDGGILMVGEAWSGDNDVPSNAGLSDGFVVKINPNGTVSWSRATGGSGLDRFYGAVEASDGSIFCIGTARSFGASVVLYDYWVVKYSADGTFLWSEIYEGNSSDYAYAGLETADGNILIGGYTTSDGPMPGQSPDPGDNSDRIWMLEIDLDGNVVTSETYGGFSVEQFSSLHPTSDGGYIVGGNTLSFSPSNCTGFTSWDYWLLKIDANLNEEWNRTYGGTQNQWLKDAIETSDGGYVMTGYHTSGATSCDVPPSIGGNDIWTLKINMSGDTLWSKMNGGSASDSGYSIVEIADEGYLISARSASSDNGISNYGLNDALLLMLDKSTGDLIWQNNYGGSGSEGGPGNIELWNVLKLFDNGELWLGSPSTSMDFDVPNNFSTQKDFWLAGFGQIEEPPCSVTDSLALVALYEATNGESWISSWNLTLPMDDWLGIEIDPTTRCVTCIDLDGDVNCSNPNTNDGGRNLVGTIPEALTGLASLRSLSLSNNLFLTGEIPDFSNHQTLRHLYLWKCNFNGNIPNLSDMPNFRQLHLYDNMLEGAIPALSNVPELRQIQLQRNNLSGTFPDLQEKPFLRLLTLQDNMIEGPISNFDFPALEMLNLERNNLDGTIPNFSNMPVLRELYLGDNNFTGTIPAFPNLNNLEILFLGFNSGLIGPIPEFSTLTELTDLGVSNCGLNGELPNLTNLPLLQEIYFYKNNLTGNIPPSYDNLGSLNILLLHDNDLSGCVPPAMTSNLCNIDSLNLSNNPLLPWEGDYQLFCSGQDQIGAVCDDGNPDTENDIIQADCSCLGSPCSINADLSGTNPFCFGDSFGGTVTATPTTGDGNYSYIWNTVPEQTTSTATNLFPGEYIVTITDGQGCTFIGSTTITESPQLTTNNTSTDITTNGANDGTATANVSGGIPPYQYSWCNGQSTQTATDLPAGNCNVTVTDGNGCTIINGVTINEPSTLDIVITNQINLACLGENSGSATIEVSGGTPPYTYQWCNGQNTDTVTDLIEGQCCVTVTDDAAAQSTTCVTITAPSLPEINFVNIVDDICSNSFFGLIEVEGFGGTGPYEFNWDANTGNQTGNQANSLGTGDYVVTIIDANGCTNTNIATINAPDELTIEAVPVSAFCNGENSGGISFNVNGGTSPYQYLVDFAPYDNDPADLAAGIYQVAVTDANGCSAGFFDVQVEEPDALTLNLSSTDITTNGANDGTATANVSGGTPPYQYSWCNGQSTQTATDLPAGNCNVIVTDGNGCTIIDGISINEPSTINIVISNQFNLGCFGDSNGSAMVEASGGVAPYSYLWCNGQTTDTATGLAAGSCCVTVTDDAMTESITCVNITAPVEELTIEAIPISTLCNADNSGSILFTPNGGTAPYQYLVNSATYNNDPTDLAAGTYQVAITDANGCSAGFFDVQINEPDPLLLNLSSTNITTNGANDGTATANITGGNAPYNYQWCNGQTTPTATGLPPGNCDVTITDNNNCTITDMINISEPEILTAIISNQTDVLCAGENNGSATIEVSGGVAPYSYLWCNGNTSETANDLSVGNCGITVTDFNNNTTQVSVDIAEPSALELTTSTVAAPCNGTAEGTATAVVTDGTAPYSYDWSNGQSSANLNNLIADIYQLTVTDVNGCTVIGQAEVLEPLAINVAINGEDTFCEGEFSTLSVDANFETYQWSTGETGPIIEVDFNGSYNITVTDSDGCTASDNFSASMIVTPTAEVGADRVACKTNMVLSANLPQGTFGKWTSWTGSNIETPDNPTTYVDELKLGNNYFVWSLAATGCTNYTFDTLGVLLDTLHPTAIPDFYRSIIDIPLKQFNPFENDESIDLSNFTINIINEPTEGQLMQNDDQTFSFIPTSDFQGTTYFDYELCNINCETACSRATVAIEVKPFHDGQDDVTVVLTDNGDGKNDFLFFDNLEKYPNNELFISNRWGSLIYNVSPYKNEWNGFNQKGKSLPDGTYYFLMKFDIGEGEFIRGSVTVIRD